MENPCSTCNLPAFMSLCITDGRCITQKAFQAIVSTSSQRGASGRHLYFQITTSNALFISEKKIPGKPHPVISIVIAQAVINHCPRFALNGCLSLIKKKLQRMGALLARTLRSSVDQELLFISARNTDKSTLGTTRSPPRAKSLLMKPFLSRGKESLKRDVLW